MYPLRNKIPKRRASVSAENDYKKYSLQLKEDFNHKCGYCDDSYLWRTTWYEVDHFIPQKKFPHRNPSDYNNLVFACRSCNNSKRSKWPTENENMPHDGMSGFIDPCSNEYDNQFKRKFDGNIRYTTDLGRWMFHALKLHRPQHQLIWIIEQLDNNIEQLNSLLSLIQEGEIQDSIRDNLNTLLLSYRKYTKKLGEI